MTNSLVSTRDKKTKICTKCHKRKSTNHYSHWPNGHLEETACAHTDLTNSVSLILSTQGEQWLNAANHYVIHFALGMLEHQGITVNQRGNRLTFQRAGSYVFNLVGQAYGQSNAQVVYYSTQFKPEIQPFTQLTVTNHQGVLQLNGLSTILPLTAGQTIKVKLRPDQLTELRLAPTKLLIYRVA